MAFTRPRHATKKPRAAVATGKRKTSAQLGREIDEELARARAIWSRSKPVETGSPSDSGTGSVELDDDQRKKLGLCTYCGKPTRKGSAVIDGWCAHKSCIAEYED